jgi:uncharacterized membrane protein (UPF0127 family)
MKTVEILLEGNKIVVPVKEVKGINKIIGLMFKDADTSNLLFSFEKKTRQSIHSWFLSFNFLIVWLDSENKVLAYRFVEPFQSSIRPNMEFDKFIEIPINFESREIIERFLNLEVVNKT